MPYSCPFQLILSRQQDALMDLIDAGVFSMDTIDEDHGASLLHWAIDHRCDKLAIYLGCELNGTETAEGYTPLDSVLYRNPGFTELIELIKSKGGLKSADLSDDDDEDEDEDE